MTVPPFRTTTSAIANAAPLPEESPRVRSARASLLLLPVALESLGAAFLLLDELGLGPLPMIVVWFILPLSQIDWFVAATPSPRVCMKSL